MTTAILYGFLASSSLLIGASIGLLFSPPRRLVAAIMAFGSGVLISALAFDLMAEAFEMAGAAFVIAGFFCGAVIFVAVDLVLEMLAASTPRREGRNSWHVKPEATNIPATKEQVTISGTALLAGAILDGIPENTAIGTSLQAEGGGIGIVLVAAIFLSNLPESISSATGMRREGRSRTYVFVVWGVATIACTVAAVAGYALLADISPNVIGAVLALAAGGILAMLADTMMPEAFEGGGPFIALATVTGFACSFFLHHLTV